MDKLEYEKLACSSLRDLLRVFVVDTASQDYAELLPDKGEIRQLSSGRDFYGMLRRDYLPRVFIGDRERVLSALKGEKLLRLLKEHPSFSLLFRLQMEEGFACIRLKASLLTEGDPKEILLAFCDAAGEMGQLPGSEEGIRQDLSYAMITRALASDYICIYCVDLESGAYQKYSESQEYKEMHFPDAGEDFFGDGIRAMSDVIHEEDREIWGAAFRKDNICRVLTVDRSFSLTYRMRFQGEYAYISIKASRVEEGNCRQMVVGFSNVDAHMKRVEEYERMREESARFDRVAQALAADFITIFYVNIKNDSYIEYRNGHRQGTGLGSDFFKAGRDGLMIDVCEEDRDMVSLDFRKKKVLRSLQEQQTYTLIYRVILDGKLRYASMKAAKIEGDEEHIIIGIRNVDDEIRREEDYACQLRSAKALADTDALTGALNRNACSRREACLTGQIQKGTAPPFGVAVFDVNGLKQINDTLGHKAGDDYICEAARLIGRVFQKSGLYRIGGDEFTVILEGEDYARRHALMRELDLLLAHNQKSGKVVLAAGLAECLPGDQSFSDVFERADTAMYARKREQKRAV